MCFTGLWGGRECQQAKLYCIKCWPSRQAMLLAAVGKTKTAVGGEKKCKCGSKTHFRTNHSSCPLNKNRKKNQKVGVVACVTHMY